MLRKIGFCLMVALVSAVSNAAPKGSFGIQGGFGAPFLSQYGVQYYLNSNLNIAASMGGYSIGIDTSSVALSVPELSLNYHPFSGAFFVGAGIGQQSVTVTSTDFTTGYKVTMNVSGLAPILKSGWMWGAANGGFWFGMDVAYVLPMSPTVDIDAPGVPTSSTEYQNALDAATAAGETAYMNITFARIGWLF